MLIDLKNYYCLKYPYYPIYRFSTISIKIPMEFYRPKTHHKICVDSRKILNNQSNLEKEEQN